MMKLCLMLKRTREQEEDEKRNGFKSFEEVKILVFFLRNTYTFFFVDDGQQPFIETESN